jgi:DNA-binding PadR family transcriptional regulator
MNHRNERPPFFEGRMGRGHGRSEGEHHGGRIFGHGDMRYVILSLLSQKPSYGYELIKVIEERLSGAYSPSPGLVYPTLTMLEEMGFVTSESMDGNKKFFSITPQGRTFLEINKPTIDRITAHMAHVADLHRRGEDPRLVRATQNLKLTLRLKSIASKLSDDQINLIAEALDEAARKVEKC